MGELSVQQFLYHHHHLVLNGWTKEYIFRPKQEPSSVSMWLSQSSREGHRAQGVKGSVPDFHSQSL